MNDMNILMMTWVVGFISEARHQAFVCSSGSKGYSAFRRSLEPGYPQHTILLTNVDVREMLQPQERNNSSHSNEEDRVEDGSGQSMEEYSGDALPVRPFSGIFQVRKVGTAFDFVSRRSGKTIFSLLNGQRHVQVVSNVPTTPINFLQECKDLRTIDISGLRNVTKISGSFLYGCSGLSTIDFSALENVVEISMGFLAGCTGLTSIDLTGFGNVKILPTAFLSKCTGLKTIKNLKALRSVVHMPALFLCECTALTEVDFIGMENIKSIQFGFLLGCTSLTSVDLTPFINVATLPTFDEFVKGMPSTTSVEGGTTSAAPKMWIEDSPTCWRKC